MNLLIDLTASQPNADGKVHGGGKYNEKVFLTFSGKDFSGNAYAFYDASLELKQNLRDHAIQNGIRLINIQNENLLTIIQHYQIDRLFSALPFSLLGNGLEEVLFQTTCEVYGVIHGLRTLELPASKEALAYTTSWKEKLKITAKVVLQNNLVKRDKSRYDLLLSKTHVICVSNHTQKAIHSFFPKYKQEIPVLYSPNVTDLQDTSPCENQFSEKNYFLMVNGNRWIKNNLRSAIALDELFSKHPEMTQKVVITGIQDQSVYLNKLKNKDRFIFLDYVSESFLQQIYQNAYAFIYMSLNEGFGYPPLDAMWHKIPVIASNFTSIPEVCGDAVLYANPFSIKEIKTQIRQLQDEEIRKSLIEKGNQQYQIIKERQEIDLNNLIALIGS